MNCSNLKKGRNYGLPLPLPLPPPPANAAAAPAPPSTAAPARRLFDDVLFDDAAAPPIETHVSPMDEESRADEKSPILILQCGPKTTRADPLSVTTRSPATNVAPVAPVNVEALRRIDTVPTTPLSTAPSTALKQ
jgi:hypothetical protein